MFRGIQRISMDAKGRLAIPARLRQPLQASCDGRIVITIEPQFKCLLLYPLPRWEQIEKAVQDLSSFDLGAKRFQRLFLGYATEFELDGNGRLLLPQLQREYAELEKDLVLVGQGKKAEIWSERLWAAEQEQALAAAAEGSFSESLGKVNL